MWWALGIVIGMLLGVGVVLVWMIRTQQSQGSSAREVQELSVRLSQELGQLRTSFQDQWIALGQQMQQHSSQNSRFLLDSHKEYADSVEKLQHRLGELQQATKSMMDIGKDIASLQDILKTPKLRGGLGEFFLGQLLADLLPEEHFTLQYGFKSGAKVDAVIQMGEGMICVDAKFPLENFKRYLEEHDEDAKAAVKKQFVRDVKNRIDEIADKYILPEEGTFDFALMYIPAENVYYETIIKSDSSGESLSDYCLRKKVIPVSPNSFYAYLQAIARGLRGLKIEKSALQVFKSLEQLETDFKKVYNDLEKMGGHFSNAQSAYDRTLKGFEKIQSRLTAIEEHHDARLIPSEDASNETNSPKTKTLA